MAGEGRYAIVGPINPELGFHTEEEALEYQKKYNIEGRVIKLTPDSEIPDRQFVYINFFAPAK